MWPLLARHKLNVNLYGGGRRHPSRRRLASRLLVECLEERALLSLTTSSETLTITAGQAFSGAVGSFQDLSVQPANNQFSATINWGDGTTTSGSILEGIGASIYVDGTHTYTSAGSFTITWQVTDTAGDSATASSKANVTWPGTPNQAYVESVYELVLGRPADQFGLGYWTAQLDNGAALSGVATSLTHSAEYFGNIIITPAYEKYLGRAPDAAGLAYWVDQMQNDGVTDEVLEAGFIGSAEFYSHAGGTDQDWVDAMYEDLLGRAADAAGEAYWVAQLQNGANRAAVADGFAASLEREQERIAQDYQHYLNRQPDVLGLNYWVNQFASGVTNEDVITGFISTVEFYHTQTGVDPPNGGLGDNKAALAGNYAGTFFATSSASGYGGPLNSGIQLSIDASGAVNVTDAAWGGGYPGAMGQGQVYSDGSINFSVAGASGYGGGWLVQGGANFVFSGTISLENGVMMAAGTWTSTTAIGHATGNWSISHQ